MIFFIYDVYWNLRFNNLKTNLMVNLLFDFEYIINYNILFENLYFEIYLINSILNLISKLLFEHEINDWLLKTEAFLRLMMVHQDLITLIFFPLTNNLVFDTSVCCIILYFQFWANMSFPMLISNTDSSLRKQVRNMMRLSFTFC
jgi:hypothetical protein